MVLPLQQLRQEEMGIGPRTEVEEGQAGNAPQREAGEEHP